MKFYQHNHSDEFSFATDNPQVRLYDVLLAETDPELVYLEMDIYWAYSGQFRFSKRPDGTPAPFEPLDYVLRQPHRYPLFHVKDGVSDPPAPYGYRMTDVGDGDIDYRTVHLRRDPPARRASGPPLAGRARQPDRVPHLRPPLQRVPPLTAREVLTATVPR